MYEKQNQALPLKSATLPAGVAELSCPSHDDIYSLIGSHLTLCHLESSPRFAAHEPTTPFEHECVEEGMKRFRALSNELLVNLPARYFLHSAHIVPGDQNSPWYVSFLAEVRDASGSCATITNHGSFLSKEGVLATHVKMSPDPSVPLIVTPLYSRSAFHEELDRIAALGPAIAMGVENRPPSYLVTTALRSISQQLLVSKRCIEPSGIVRLAPEDVQDSSARLVFDTHQTGRVAVQLSLDNTRRLNVTGLWALG